MIAILGLWPFVGAKEQRDYFAWRTWSIAGKAVQAQLESWTNDRAFVSLRAAGGKRIELMHSDLVSADSGFVSEAIGAAEEQSLKREMLPVSSPLFKPEALLSRGTIPAIDHREFGQKASDSSVAAFTNFVLWWDQENLLPIGRRGDFEKKAEAVQTWISRYCETRNTVGTRGLEARKGFGSYFDEHLSEAATFNSRFECDISPANLTRYTGGCNATLLTMGFIKGRDTYRQTVSLVSVDPSGEIVFLYEGIKASGKMVVWKKSDKMVDVPGTGHLWRKGRPMQANGTVYEVEFADAPKFRFFEGAKVILDPSLGHQLVVFKPYLFAQPGKKCRPPDDPLFPLE